MGGGLGACHLEILKNKAFWVYSGGRGLQTPKKNLDTALNMPRSSPSILNKLMLIMFMFFLLCANTKTDILSSISYLRFTAKIPRNRTIFNLMFICSNFCSLSS